MYTVDEAKEQSLPGQLHPQTYLPPGTSKKETSEQSMQQYTDIQSTNYEEEKYFSKLHEKQKLYVVLVQ